MFDLEVSLSSFDLSRHAGYGAFSVLFAFSLVRFVGCW